MGLGLDWILAVAHMAKLDGAVRHVMTPGPLVLPLIALGACLFVLWQGRGRLAGLVPVRRLPCCWGCGRPIVLIAVAKAARSWG